MKWTNVIKVWQKYSQVFLQGLGGTLWISAVVLLAGSILGLFISLLRMSKIKPFRMIGAVYVEILRGPPILLQLYFF